MAQAETLQDIYTKIADIYDKFCNLDSDPVTAIQNQLVIGNDFFTTPTITFENPDGDSQIEYAQQEINKLLAIAFQTVGNLEYEYYQAAGDGTIQPSPKSSAISWLPKLISILVLYRAPLKFLANLIVDFIKEILLEEIKKRVNQKTNYFVGSIIANSPTRFNIPYNADKIIVICTNIPEYLSKRFDREYNGQNDRFIPSLATISIGLTSQYTGDIFWTNDMKVEYRNQLIDIPNLKNLSNLKGYIYLENGIQAQIIFVQFL